MSTHGKKFIDPPMLDAKFTDRGMKLGFGIGLVGLVASLAALGMGEEAKTQFFFSWLTAFMVFLTIALGSLFIIIIHHLTRAGWDTGLRRILENIACNLPLMALMFIPIVIGMQELYHWARPEVVAADPILQWKAGYLNTGFFLGRAAFFFGVWGFLAWFFRSNSVKQDASGDEAITFKMRRLAPVATLLYAFTLTFAVFDWAMSLDAHWFSTMFGVYVFAGGVMTAFAVLSLIGLWFTKNGQLTKTITVGNLHDSGKLMWGFIIFWAYVTFSQYYLIWYANIPEETAWFGLRMTNGWEKIGALLIIGHFILPFFFLISRHAKRNRLALGLGSGWLVLMHVVDMYYLVAPTLHHHGPHFHWLDVTTLLAVGGIFLGVFMLRFKKTAAVAHRDPQLVASMEYDNF